MSTRRKVLLVDDSPIVRAVVAHTLSASGVDVEVIDDPGALDEAVTRVCPDLLLVDATFPDVDDEQLVAAVRRHSATLPVVLFSDRAEADVRALVDRCGARGFVAKGSAELGTRLDPFFSAP